ncbi:MAG: hypothetical protein OZSIB_3275 [Candidatus Ozemobacter sibiricus]|uniref:Uncharacterized protein n=1 Tax=Candidatus Ozemobacter sibiricus TaxID=2268124 RepID=A0A367ZS11_9BACT|nr:MAG: hypothetical protein OZSIB_3275 [Candidatus Ozemobacter sibiricus]
MIAETAPDIQPASDVLSVDLGDLPIEERDLATEAASLLLGTSEPPSEPARRQKKPVRPRGEKAPALEPVLLLGAEEELQALARQEAEKSVTLEGYLKIEEHPIARRAAVRRWVLETASGTRIPLQSTLAFITELKKDGIFDQPVRLTGVWRPSPGNERLRFFAADRIEPRPEPEEGGVASAPLLASGPMTAPGPAGASATAFIAYEDELAAGASQPRPATALASPAPPLTSPAAVLSRRGEDPGPGDQTAPASASVRGAPRVP